MRRTVRRAAFAGLLVLAGLSAPTAASAQELACTVNIDISQLKGTDYQYLQRVPERLMDFLNNTRWTEDIYREQERIQCAVTIYFDEALSTYTFRTRASVVLQRPVYGTSSMMKVLELLDENWQFTYTDGQALQYDPNRYDPLTSVLAFYAYVLLGYDYDTFGELGGTKYFQEARRIADRAQGQGAPGWQQIGNEPGRYTLITQITDKRFEPLRLAYFQHHFEGLDHFTLDPITARTNIMAALEAIETLYEETSDAYVIDLFFNAKYTEFAGIFEDSPLAQTAYTLLADLDGSHLSEYQKIVN